MKDTNYTTRCIDWEDDKWETPARSARSAAEIHASEGSDSESPDKPECVTIEVTEGESTTYWVVVGDRDSATAAPAPRYVIDGLISGGELA